MCFCAWSEPSTLMRCQFTAHRDNGCGNTEVARLLSVFLCCDVCWLHSGPTGRGKIDVARWLSVFLLIVLGASNNLFCDICRLLSGPTGCGKTEIARRLAKLTHAPFIKVSRALLFSWEP